jgi:hypothetical protein
MVKGRAFLSSLMDGVAREASDGSNGLRGLVETWIDKVCREVGGDDDTVKSEIERRLHPLRDRPGGVEFAQVLIKYFEGYQHEDTRLQDAALQWLRGEFSTKTEARKALGVYRILGDNDVYVAIRNFAVFCRIAGHGGLIVVLDELSALTDRLDNKKAREGSFLTILSMVNDSFQGKTPGLGFIFAATPGALDDEERGLLSNPALASRLEPVPSLGSASNGPILGLKRLKQEDVFMLLKNILNVHARGDVTNHALPEEGLRMFLEKCAPESDNARYDTRLIARSFTELLRTLESNPNSKWPELVNVALPAHGTHSSSSN